MPREKSPHATCAAAIRKVLKQLSPTTKFRVNSSVYSGGDSVYVNWVDGPTYDAVNAIVRDYQEGSFNSMEDIYEYDNKKDLPQVKYVLPQREMSDAVREKLKAEMAQKFGVDMDDDHAVRDKTCHWPSELISREFRKTAY